MADTKISALTALSAPASGDLIPIVDVSDTTMAASGTTKSVTSAVLFAAPAPVGSTTPSTGAFTSLSSTIGANFATSSGSVGIGTSSPGSLLDCASAITVVRIRSTSAGVSSHIRFYVNGYSNAFAGQETITGGLASGSLTGSFVLGGGGATATHIMTDSAVRLTVLPTSGNVGIGTTAPSYLLHVNTDSAGKPGASGLWTVVSDERIKENIVPADLSRCYDIVKQVGLKHYGYKPGVYSDAQVKDRNALGWIAQDVQKVFSKAVSVKPFTLQTDIPDGTETYEEQAFTVHITNKVETSIEIVDGKPVRVSKDVQTEEKVLLFDDVIVVDEDGEIVLVDDEPLTHKMPRMVTKTRPKVRREVIEDCLDLNAGQMHAALYGAVQHLMSVVEAQAEAIAELQASV